MNQVRQRLNMVCIVAARKGAGKTTFTMRTVQEAGYERVLYMMIDDHPAYRHLRTFYDHQLDALKVLTPDKKYCVRVLTTKPLEAFFKINTLVSNCCVVSEDTANWMDYNLPEAVKQSIISSKQKNNDIIFQFHNLQDIPPRLLKLADVMSLFRVNDTPQTTGKKIPPKVWQYLAQVEREYDPQKNPWPQKTFDLWD